MSARDACARLHAEILRRQSECLMIWCLNPAFDQTFCSAMCMNEIQPLMKKYFDMGCDKKTALM